MNINISNVQRFLLQPAFLIILLRWDIIIIICSNDELFWANNSDS